MTTQLPLPLLLDDECTFANFYPGNNQALLDCLQQWIDDTPVSKEQFIFLWGSHGVGSSHLLQATCRAAGLKQLSHYYLDFSAPDLLDPLVLQNLENISLIALDNIQAILGKSHWEEALFNCYNRLREKNQRLIVAADSPPQLLNCQLNDLRSRLCSGLSWQIHPLSDPQKIAALILRAKNRGLVLSPEIAQFLLHHCPRNMDFLIKLLEEIDQAALTAQHRLTIPFIKKVLKQITTSDN